MSSSSNSKESLQGDDSLPKLPEELDNVVRPAKIYLAITHVLLNTGEGEYFNHHSLAIEFPGEFWVVIEGKNFEGKLGPSYTKTKRDVFDAKLTPLDKAWRPSSNAEIFIPPLYWMNLAKRGFMPRIFNIKISPCQLLEVARNNKHNSKPYPLGLMDTPKWVVTASKKIQKLSDENEG